MIVLKCLWIVLSYLVVPHRLHGLTCCWFCFMLGCLAEFVLLPANIMLQLTFV